MRAFYTNKLVSGQLQFFEELANKIKLQLGSIFARENWRD